MTIDSAINHLISTNEGLAILSLLTIAATSVVYEIIKHRFFFIARLMRRHLLMKAVVTTSEGFEVGYKVARFLGGYRIQKGVLRVLHIALSLLHILLIFVIALICTIVALIIPYQYMWILVIVASFMVTVQYKKLRLHIEIYQTATRIIYQRKEDIVKLREEKLAAKRTESN